MTITLESSVALAGQAEVASKLTITVTGDEVTTSGGADDWKRLYGPAYLPSAAGTIVTVGAGVKWIISSIHVVNTDTSARWFQLWTGGTAGSNALTPQFTISAGGCAVYSNEGWRFYDSAGKLWGSQSATGGTPALVFSTSNAAGSSTNFIRDDDQLALFDTTAPVTQAFGDAAAVGTAAFAARRDHKHGMPTAPAGGTPALVFSTTNAAGVASTFLRTDDQLALFDATAPTTSALADAAAVGTAAFAARRDHKHGRESFATPAIVLGSAAAAGAAATPIRSDSTIAAFDATAPTTQAAGDAAAVGTAAFAARRDHKHGMPTWSLNPHGAADHTDITRSLYFTAAPTQSDGQTDVVLGTLPDALRTESYADAATQGNYLNFAMPKDCVAGSTLSIRIPWFPGSTDATPHTVRWSVNAKALVAASDPTAAGTTTAFTGSSAARTANQMVMEAATQILASVNADDIIRVSIRRLGADAADTYVGAVRVPGFYFDYTANQ